MAGGNTMGGETPRLKDDAPHHRWGEKALQRRRAGFADRFWAKVDRTGNPAECWPWRGGLHMTGYGYFGRPRKLAHRIAFELTNGDIPAGLCVLHRCDNPPCVNPTHLWLGTRTENSADMVTKNRQPRFVGAKLTPFLAAEARLLYSVGMTQKALAARYGVARGTILALLRGKTWR